jgi:hypothetical protein
LDVEALAWQSGEPVPAGHQQAPSGLLINLVLEFRRLGAAAEIEVRDETPLATEINMLVNHGPEGGRCLSKVLRLARLIGQGHPKENGRIAALVVLESIAPFHDAGSFEIRELIELFDQSCGLRATFTR